MRGHVPEPSEEDFREAVGLRLESHLEDFMVTNFEMIFGDEYELFINDEGVIGKWYPVTNEAGSRIGKIDIIAMNRCDNSLLVIELKRDYGVDKAVGQVLWHMGWVKSNLCGKDQDVKGQIVCTDRDERLEYALEMIRGLVDVRFYAVSFQLRDVPISH